MASRMPISSLPVKLPFAIVAKRPLLPRCQTTCFACNLFTDTGSKVLDSNAGLPDGLFSNQKSQFGQILEGLRLENADIFYCQWECLKDSWDIL
jgi:hypothetical protein